MVSLLKPQWPAPKNIHAATTQRYPGVSQHAYAGLNVAEHVGDDPAQVAANRHLLRHAACLPQEPKWLQQTHSTRALRAETIAEGARPQADATYTQHADVVCVVMTADCLPILVTNTAGSEVAAIHAGWQGLAAGIVEQTLAQLASPPASLLIWIGPAIQAAQYRVGIEVYTAFATRHSPAELRAAFVPITVDQWYANLPRLACQRLQACGVRLHNIYVADACTAGQPQHYFSYRRDGVTGRMASFIYRAAE